jgi:hypothetical protein
VGDKELVRVSIDDTRDPQLRKLRHLGNEWVTIRVIQDSPVRVCLVAVRTSDLNLWIRLQSGPRSWIGYDKSVLLRVQVFQALVLWV